jgi:UPF0042 nucleotide-binding protein
VNEFLVITGLSGAGGTQVGKVLEDNGWFVIDNLPPVLIEKVADLARAPGSAIGRVALVLRAHEPDEVDAAIRYLRSTTSRVRVLYLTATDAVLVRRFEDTRHRHTFDDELGLAAAIAAERAAMEPLADHADVVLDTSDLNVHQLRARLESLLPDEESTGIMQTAVMSFGYKHGLPLDVDMVLDCRFLPNPHWVERLRPKTGLDSPVKRYVLGFPETKEFLGRLESLLDLLLPAYAAEGKAYFTIALGCTGGHHRSVVIAEQVADMLRSRGFDPRVLHRDVDR